MTGPGIRPWLSIWIKPKQTVRTLINYNVKYRFFILSFLYGLPTLFQVAQNLSLGSIFSLPALLLICAVLSPILGALGLLLCTAFILWTGRILGGKASFLEMRCAVSWSNATNLATVIVWGALIFQFREFVFYEGFVAMPMSQMESTWLTVCFLVQFIVAVWSFILLLYAVSEVHRFSAWKALLNIVMAFVVGVGASWVFMLLLERIADLRV